MINFALFGQPAHNGDTAIYLRINSGSKKIRMSTKLAVPARNWSQPAQMIIKGGSFDYPFYREKLANIVTAVESIIRTANLENWDLQDVQKKVAMLLGAKVPSNGKGVLSLYQEWAIYGTATKTTTRRQDKQRYSVFAEFVNNVDIPFRKVDYTFYTDFLAFLRIKKQYKENTVATHIKSLKAVMSEGLKRKLHDNLDFQQFGVATENIVNINLTTEEIKRLYNLQLEGDEERVRDVFVLGCYVAQRHSDYSRISKNDIQGNILTIVQQKTNHRIRIPLHPIAKEIIDKYDGKLPNISLTIFNKVIKHLAYKAKIKGKILVRTTKAGKKEEKYVEKWELVSSHTARKSGVTNALRAGVPIEDCMYLAGIKSESVFKKYAGIADDEYTERLANSQYFSGVEDIEGLLAYVASVIRSGESPEWLKRLQLAYRTQLKK